MPSAVLAVFMAMWLFVGPAAAQTALATDGAAGQTGSPAAAEATGASLSHSAMKAITYKLATTTVNLTIYSVAAGSMVAGTALTVFGAAASLAVFTGNDYLWANHLPPPPKPDDGQGFDVTESAWRTTEKFLTYKAATLWIKVIKAASLYAYTGSAAATLAAVSVATALNAGVFFANNLAWDYVDSLTTPPAAAPPPPAAVPPPAPVVARLPEALRPTEAAPKS
jgi:hypothetical protein